MAEKYWQLEKIGVVGRNIHDFSDTDIESGQSYTYKIRAIRGDTPFLLSARLLT